MRKEEITIGGEYLAKVSGDRVRVKVTGRIDGTQRPWVCTNLKTGREVRKSSAALSPLPEDRPVKLAERSLNSIAALVGANLRLFPEATVAKLKQAVRAKWPRTTERVLVACDAWVDTLWAGREAKDLQVARDVLAAGGDVDAQLPCYTPEQRARIARIMKEIIG